MTKFHRDNEFSGLLHRSVFRLFFISRFSPDFACPYPNRRSHGRIGDLGSCLAVATGSAKRTDFANENIRASRDARNALGNLVCIKSHIYIHIPSIRARCNIIRASRGVFRDEDCGGSTWGMARLEWQIFNLLRRICSGAHYLRAFCNER